MCNGVSETRGESTCKTACAKSAERKENLGSCRADGAEPSSSDKAAGHNRGHGAQQPRGPTGPADGQKTYACYGLTMFSQQMLVNKKLPVCTGWRARPQLTPDLRGALAETTPASNFKYVCVGVCAYEEAQLRANHAELLRNPAAPVVLPYCEGLEVVSSSDPVPIAAPALLPQGGIATAAGTSPVSPTEKPKQPRPRFATPIQGMSGDPLDFTAFSDKFMKSAGKIARQMSANLALMRDTVKKVTGIGK